MLQEVIVISCDVIYECTVESSHYVIEEYIFEQAGKWLNDRFIQIWKKKNSNSFKIIICELNI